MLLRAKEPNKGRWNGVGGKIEPDETPSCCCKREVLEETGLQVTDLSYRGIISLDGADQIYVFISRDFAGTVIDSPEGILEWKTIDWILQSSEVVTNIPLFLETILDPNTEPRRFECRYSSSGELISFEIKKMEGLSPTSLTL